MAPNQRIRVQNVNLSLFRSVNKDASAYFNSNVQRWIAECVKTPRDQNFENENFEIKIPEIKNPETNSNRLKCLFVLICSAGLLYHLNVITNEYLSYQMVTSTSVLSRDIVEPPAISICVELEDFRAYFPDNCSLGDQNICPLENYSLHDVMNKYSGSLSENLYFFNYESNDFFDENVDQNILLQNQTLQYYFDRHKCIRINCSLNNIVSDKTSDINGPGLETDWRQDFLLHVYIWFKGAFKNKHRKDWANFRIMLHEPKKIAHNRDAPVVLYYWYPDNEPNTAKLNYYQVTTKYLKKPFAHACYDYAKDGNMESRGDCQEKCLRDGILRKYGKVGRCLSTTVYDDTIPYDAPYRDEEIDKECIKKCRLDCNTMQYTPLHVLSARFKYRNSFEVQLLSIYPETFIKFSPQFDLLSYLIYSGGTVGMWIGLSLFSTFSSTTDYLIVFQRKIVLKNE